MSDIINQINNETTGDSETWITIKDASDLLGVSERHAWNIVTKNGFQTKKLLNRHRKKAYCLRSDIEKFHKAEEERQKLEALKSSSLSEKSELSEMSERKGELEMSESGNASISESGTALSERAKSLPALLQDLQAKKESLQKDVVKWRVTSLWIGILGIAVVGMLGLYVFETKTALSESEKVISERETMLSESRKALSEMSERVFMLSEREKEALKALAERDQYIKTLEEKDLWDF